MKRWPWKVFDETHDHSSRCIHSRPGGIQWWIIPTFVPFIGAPVGAWIYYLMVGVHCETSGYSKHQGDTSELVESQAAVE